MYFVLECPLPETENGEALMEIHNCFEVGDVWNWRDGIKLEPDEENVPTPIEIELEPFRGYDGPPAEMVDVCVPIISKRLAEQLLKVGVDNLELFEAILTNTKTGNKYDYFAFNLVGLVSATDLGQSNWASYDGKLVGDVSIRKLVVDESKSKGQMMFRMAENFSGLMVHENVRDHLIASGIDTLVFTKPEEWVQL